MNLFTRQSRAARSASAFLILMMTLVLAAWSQPGAASAAGFSVTLVQGGFTQPVFVTNAGDARLFVVEQTGKIKIIGGGTFLDLTSKIVSGPEQGLLGLAFHPDYATNGLFYVKYNAKGTGKNVIAEYHVSANPNVANPASARIVLSYGQPTIGHNGGWLGFSGQYLYISQGDASLRKSPAQDLDRRLGKILRIDPLDPDAEGPLTYSIPADNPFVGTSHKQEIWAYGLRNPWRCSFDHVTGNLWCGDAGQSLHEEIDRSDAAGNNYGWPLLEGFHYYQYPNKPADALCTSGDCKVLPIAEYGHGRRCAVAGGYVSRRPGAVLEGKYVFGDYCTGQVWVIPADYVAGTKLPTPAADLAMKISSFGEGVDGRLYVVDIRHGKISVIDQS